MWAKFDDGYDANPKCRAAGLHGRALDQAGIRYAAKNLTDGLIPDHDLSVLCALAGVHRNRALPKLLEVGRWHGPGHDCPSPHCVPCPPGHHVVHDYLQWNPTAERERAKRAARAEAGRVGGQRSRPRNNPEATTEANASPFAEQDAQAIAEAHRNPVPVPVLDTFSDNSRRPTVQPDDDPGQQAPLTTPETVDRALTILVARDLAARQAAPGLEPIHEPTAWRRRALAERRGRGTSAALTELAQLNPGATPEALADLLEPATTAHGGPPPRPDPRAAQQAAERQRQLEGNAQHAALADIEPAPPEAVAAALNAARDALPRTRRTP